MEFATKSQKLCAPSKVYTPTINFPLCEFGQVNIHVNHGVVNLLLEGGCRTAACWVALAALSGQGFTHGTRHFLLLSSRHISGTSFALDAACSIRASGHLVLALAHGLLAFALVFAAVLMSSRGDFYTHSTTIHSTIHQSFRPPTPTEHQDTRTLPLYNIMSGSSCTIQQLSYVFHFIWWGASPHPPLYKMETYRWLPTRWTTNAIWIAYRVSYQVIYHATVTPSNKPVNCMQPTQA